MKPTTTILDFVRRGRDAGHDALGIAHDPEAIMAMAAMQRSAFLHQRAEVSLRRWRALVAEVAALAADDPATARWLGIEHARLGRAFQATALDDPTLHADASRWMAGLDPIECDEVTSQFALALLTPLTVAAEERQG